MIIQGHPDILLGAQGLNGLLGFGSLPPEGSSDAYIRFLPEMGGLGIKALYKEIRDFINTPGRTQAEIKQAMEASGVSDRDVSNALELPDSEIVLYREKLKRLEVGVNRNTNVAAQPMETKQPGSGTNLAFLAAIAASYFILGA